MKLPVYLDYAATTPVDQRVVEKMIQYLTIDGIFGNPASRSHRYGWLAEEAVDVARNHIATMIKADSREIIFTSGATESDNLAIKGVAQANQNKGRHIITSLTEHKAVLDTCKYLEQHGYRITWLVPNQNGFISLQQLSDALREDTILVSLMHVNNEIGIIHNIAAFGQLCQSHDILFHVDATQSIGKLSIDVTELPVDLMSFSSHKLYGPKGIGCLYISRKKKVHINAQIHGGGHERGIRSGTLPVHQIVGMGEAYRIAKKEMADEMLRLRVLRDRLWQGLQQIEGVTVNGDLAHGVATLLNISVNHVDGESLMMLLNDLAVSSGSACTDSNFESSYVLRALGLNDELSHSSIRFSLGRFTTKEEIDYAINKTQRAIVRQRAIARNFLLKTDN
ncbi:IscS subfamily cysteine desulfurase [Candidatus Palibaumannia cicadellinicola]|uniref:Cysteine desulfurase IscS n=1 Tax=Candidatus Palibaumannia cicadellinicola TaxID=186490 RepID=A0A2N4XXK1_9GAMM|nr:IscS subfamily cysteine desulfurase [Candidatus Baumannia cicadellinicola]PLK59295.1 IscS subfamily cysteine desulfurase [Candidatus Baumannia cicadellinicola]